MALTFPFPIASPGIQMLIAFNRFMAVFAPARTYKKLFRRAHLLPMVLAMYAGPLLFCSAGASGLWGGFNYADTGACRVDGSRYPLWSDLLAGTLIFLPNILTLAVYVAIYVRILVAKSPASRADVRKRARGSLMMFVNFCFYFVAAMPAPLMDTQQLVTLERNGYAQIWAEAVYASNFGVNLVRACALCNYIT